MDESEYADKATPMTKPEDMESLSRSQQRLHHQSLSDVKKVGTSSGGLSTEIYERQHSSVSRRNKQKLDSSVKSIKEPKLNHRTISQWPENRISGRKSRTPLLALDGRSTSMYEQQVPRLSTSISIDESQYGLDLAFLYADPLLQEISIVDQKGKELRTQIEAFNQPLGTDQEFDKIVETLKKTNKQFSIMKEVANRENLKTVLARRPVMLHISCHGDCYWDTKVKPPKNTFFLAFEGAEDQLCMLDKLTEEKLRDLLGSGGSQQLLIVFVSACHSEVIGQLFKRVGVPVVIGVNSHTAILDDVCKQFARIFYQHLVSGHSPQQSFDAGKVTVKNSKIDLFSCCCAHKHKSWCRWRIHFSKRENTKDKDAPHNAHIPNSEGHNCKCAISGLKHNEHKRRCKYALEFENKYVDATKEEFLLQVGQTTKVCCCSPELPHDESQKLKIIERTYDKDICPQDLLPPKKKRLPKVPILQNPAEIQAPSVGGLILPSGVSLSQMMDPLQTLPPLEVKTGSDLSQIKMENLQPQNKDNNINGQAENSTTSYDEEDEQEVTDQQIEEENRFRFRQFEHAVLHNPIFKNRGNGVVDVQGIKEYANQLKAQIDHKMLIGRNKSIQEIVQFLNNDDSRLMHVYGEDDMGKADIVNYASKYALYGRVALDGAIYVEAENKNSISGLIQRICQRLSEKILLPPVKDEYSRENLIGVIRERKLLIIIDKTNELIEEQFDIFNKFLEQLVQRTLKNKFIIITQAKEDIKSCVVSDFQTKLEVPHLTKRDAAQLLIRVAKASKGLSEIQSLEDLVKHKIFDIISLKPQVIIQLGLTLQNKTLDQIVNENELMRIEEEKKRQEEIDRQIQEEEEAAAITARQQSANQPESLFDPIMDKMMLENFRERSQTVKRQSILIGNTSAQNTQQSQDLLMKLNYQSMLEAYPIEKYSPEYELIYILCQMPKGLNEIDMEEFCEICGKFGDWRAMFMRISEDYELETPEGLVKENILEPKQIQVGAKKAVSQHAPIKRFKFLKISYDFQLSCQRYEPIPMFRDFINNDLDKKWNPELYKSESIKFLARLSRQILMSKVNQNDVDIRCVSAVLNAGIWEQVMSQQAHQGFSGFQGFQSTGQFQPAALIPQISEEDQGPQKDVAAEYNYWRYIFHEGNFINFLNIKQLMANFSNLSFSDPVALDLQELAICTISMMIELGHYEETSSLIEKCETLAKHFNFIPLEAKLILLNSTLAMKKRDFALEGLEDKINAVRMVSTILKKNRSSDKVVDGIGDSYFHQAILQIEMYNHGVRKQKGGFQATQAIQPTFSRGNLTLDQSQYANWDNTRLHDLIKNSREKLKSARAYYQKANVQFGIAKASLVEAEFLIEILFGYFSHNLEIEESYKETEVLLQKSRQIFKTMGYQSLEARVLKNLGYLKFKKYTLDKSSLTSSLVPSKMNQAMGTPFNELIIQDDLIVELNECIEYFKEAKKILERIRDTTQIVILNDFINEVLEEIRKNSTNVMIFVKAFPLVEDPDFVSPWDQMIGFGGVSTSYIRASAVSINQQLQNYNDGEVKQVGALTRYETGIRNAMLAKARASGQNLNVKFDLLNREILNHAAQNGCKVLHLASHVYDKDRLCIEGPHGLVDYLSVEQIKHILTQQQTKETVDIEIVVLAIPQSWKIADAFLSLGVKHVICFNLEQYCNNSRLIPNIFQTINGFCLKFYEQLFKSQSVQNSYRIALNSIYDDIKLMNDLNDHYQEANGNMKEGSDFLSDNSWAFLFPQDAKQHETALFKAPNAGFEESFGFGSSPENSSLGALVEDAKKPTNTVIDSTLKKRRITNFHRYREKGPFTGRRCLIYSLIAQLRSKQVRLINLTGPKGIGKSRLVVETAQYISQRDLFKDGVFYVDMKNVETKEEFLRKTTEIMMQSANIKEEAELDQQLEVNSILLIMDHVDDIMSKKAQFDWDVVNLVQLYKNLKLIVVSREEIDIKLLVSIQDNVATKEVPTLDLTESVDLVISNCQRMFADDFQKQKVRPQNKERDPPRQEINFYQAFSQSSQLKACGGFPLYLHTLAKLLNSGRISDINMMDKILKLGGSTDAIKAYHEKWEKKQHEMEQERLTQCVFPPAIDHSFSKIQPFMEPDEDEDIFSRIQSQEQQQQFKRQGTPQPLENMFNQHNDSNFDSRRPSMRFGGGRNAVENSSNSSMIGRPTRGHADMEEEKVPLNRQQNRPPQNEEEEYQMALQLSLQEFQEKQEFLQQVAPALSRQPSRGDAYGQWPQLKTHHPPPGNFTIPRGMLPILPTETFEKDEQQMIKQASHSLEQFFSDDEDCDVEMEDLEKLKLGAPSANKSASTMSQSPFQAQQFTSPSPDKLQSASMTKNQSNQSNKSIEMPPRPQQRYYKKK